MVHLGSAILILSVLLSACSGESHQQQRTEKIIILSRAAKVAQLTGDFDHHRQVPTTNQTNSRYQLLGTDLGSSFEHKGKTYFLFGDTVGPPGGDAIAYTTDTNPDDGLDLIFLTDAAGAYKPISIPGINQGSFEVPAAGISVKGKMYVYHTTDHTPQVVMGRTVLAVSEDDGHSFTLLSDLSTLNFINLSLVETELAQWRRFPEQSGDGLVIFGSGEYRKSNIYLAFQPSRSIELKSSLRFFTGLDGAGNPLWGTNEATAAQLFNQPCVGEFSVTYNPFIKRWIMLYNCGLPDWRGIILRSARYPWGPWTEPEILFHPFMDNGYCNFMHVPSTIMNCDSVHDPNREGEWGGEYGPYQITGLARGDDRQTTIYFTMSTWNPYTVVLMKATLQTVYLD